MDSLTKRELEILEHLSYGESNAEIARTLFISIYTVMDHKRWIFLKLNVRNSAGAVGVGFRKGLIT